MQALKKIDLICAVSHQTTEEHTPSIQEENKRTYTGSSKGGN